MLQPGISQVRLRQVVPGGPGAGAAGGLAGRDPVLARATAGRARRAAAVRARGGPARGALGHHLRQGVAAAPLRRFPSMHVCMGSAAAAPQSYACRVGLPYSPALLASAHAGCLADIPGTVRGHQAQLEDYETPMTPATAMRNALGREEGGSGMPIDRGAYEAAVAFWETRALISAGPSA